jgi:hypothetical protein
MFLMRYVVCFVWKETKKLEGHFCKRKNQCAITAKFGMQDYPLPSEDIGNPPHALDTTKKKQCCFSMYRMRFWNF